jgi:hypothetical protein
MKPYAHALTTAARARSERTGLDADAMALPPPGTCAAVAAAAQRMRANSPALLAMQVNRIADDLTSQHSPEVLRMLAGALLDRAAARHGVHPDTLRREGL